MAGGKEMPDREFEIEDEAEGGHCEVGMECSG